MTHRRTSGEVGKVIGHFAVVVVNWRGDGYPCARSVRCNDVCIDVWGGLGRTKRNGDEKTDIDKET